MNWNRGEKKLLHESRLFDVFVEREGVKHVTRFNSTIDHFKVSLKSKNSDAKDLLLSDYNLSLIRPLLHKLYNIVLESYKDKSGLLMQINLGLSQLKKQWLKSGNFDPNASESKSFCDWIVNLLEVSVFSDENISLEGLKIDVIVTKTTGHVGNAHDIQFNYMPFKCRRLARQLSIFEIYNEPTFKKKIKFGIVDLTHLNIYCLNGQCLELSIAFGLLCEKFSYHIFNTLENLAIVFNSDPEFMMHSVFNEYNIENHNIPHNNFFDLLDTYSSILERNIFLLLQNSAGSMEIFYKTDFNNKSTYNSNTIYLLYSNSEMDDKNIGHCSYIYFVNLNTFKRTFCFICQKSFTCTFKSHRCRLSRCRGCLCYYSEIGENYSIDEKSKCLSKVVHDTFIKCKSCGRIFRNKQCYGYHKIKKRLACDTHRRCKKCNNMHANIKNHSHECYAKWCFKCISYHTKNQNSCYVTNLTKFSKKKHFLFFFIIQINLSKTNLPISAYVTPVYSEKLDSLSDFKNFPIKVYAKTAFSNEILTLQDNNYFHNDIINIEKNGQYSFDYVVNPIINMICKEHSNCKIMFISDESTFEYICNYSLNNNLHIKYCGESPVSISYSNVVFKKITNFFDNGTSNLGLEIDTVNCVSTLLPLRLQICENLDDNKFTKLDINDFDIKTLYGTSYDKYERVLSEKHLLHSIYKPFNFDRILHMDITMRKMKVLTEAVLRLQCLYNCLLNEVTILAKSMFDNVKTDENKPCLFSYNTSTSAIFDLFLICTPEKSLPILTCNFQNNDRLIGTSMAEIVVCKFFFKIHKSTCKTDDILSYISGDRSQYSVPSNLTADFYCKICKVALFVHGAYKSNCEYHRMYSKDYTFFGADRKTLIESRERKIRQFHKYSKNNVSRIVEIFECCVKSPKKWSDCNNTIAKEVLYHVGCTEISLDKYQEQFRILYNDYLVEDNIPLDYQKSVQSQIVESLKLIDASNGKSSDIIRLDLSFAYMRALNAYDIEFPSSSSLVILHDDEAQTFVNNEILHCKNTSLPYCVIKARVYTHGVGEKFKFLPYFYYSNNAGSSSKDKKSSLTLCKACSDSIQIEACCHSNFEKSFVVTCLSQDLLYAENMGYSFKILELHHWPQKAHYNGFAKLASIFIKYKENSDSFSCKAVKKWALAAIGRFALNYAKFGKWKKIQNLVQLVHLNKKKELIMFDLFSSNSCYGLIKVRNSFNIQKNFKSNVCPIVLSSICSYIKRRIHSDSIKIKLSNTLQLIRIDADCITIKVFLNTDSNNEYRNIFEINNTTIFYKTEMSSIRRVISYKKRSYTLEKENFCILKSCGFSASLYTRFNLIDFEKLYRNFNLNIKNKTFEFSKNNMRIPKLSSSNNNKIIECITIPFGY